MKYTVLSRCNLSLSRVRSFGIRCVFARWCRLKYAKRPRSPRAALDCERAGKTITQTRLYSLIAVVRNDTAVGGPADLCITRAAFHWLRYTSYLVARTQTQSRLTSKHATATFVSAGVLTRAQSHPREIVPPQRQNFHRSTNACTLSYHRDKCVPTIHIPCKSYAHTSACLCAETRRGREIAEARKWLNGSADNVRV